MSKKTVNELTSEITDAIDKRLPAVFVVKDDNGNYRRYEFLALDEDMDEVRIVLTETK